MKQKKNPKTALLLSALIPGLGQLYNGQPLKAFAFFITWIIILLWPLAIIDAWESAQRINQQAVEQELTQNRLARRAA